MGYAKGTREPTEGAPSGESWNNWNNLGNKIKYWILIQNTK